MFDSSFTISSEKTTPLIDEQFLSILTSLFVDGMAGELSRKRTKTGAYCKGNRTERGVARIPLNFESAVVGAEIKAYCTRKADPRNIDRNNAPDHAVQNLRTFILGLSDAFNNLFMGIWGNVSLIKMAADPLNDYVPHIEKMESTIQNGAALINAIFGYLSERRMTAKKIRLNLLVNELIEYLPLDYFSVQLNVSSVRQDYVLGQRPAVALAETLSFMLEQIVKQVHIQYKKIAGYEERIQSAAKHLDAIKALINRAREILRHLRLFVGQNIKKQTKVDMIKMVRHEIQRIRKKHPHLMISVQMESALPRICADQRALGFVITELVDNAVNAMPDKGHLQIRVQSQKTSLGHSRAFEKGKFIILTISDTGGGMDFDTLQNIFEPFFVGRSNDRHLGMGLAAAWGVIKAHGGSVYVRSNADQGSTFHIQLPVQ